jgi:hypothetical protein
MYDRSGGTMNNIESNENIVHLVNLMSGIPRFIETLIFCLGLQLDGLWHKVNFVANVDRIVTSGRNNQFLSNYVKAVVDLLVVKYDRFVVLLEDRFLPHIAEILGYSLFGFSVTRIDRFGDYTVET